uniref:Vinculin n=1 Tax=Loa loa TaxID=7209 RepID=A0A1I7VC96_LOALO
MVSMANVQAEMNIDRVKTRTVEQLIAPLIQQVTNLMTPNGMHSLKRSGKSGAVLVAAIERTVCNFVEIGRSAIAECPIAVGNALEQLNETLQDVEHAGIEMVNTGHDFVQETSNTDRRARAIRAARNLLTVVARMLIMADMVDVRMMLLQVAKVEDIMDRLVAAESKQELSELFESLNSCMEQLDGNIKRRILELRNPAEQDDLQAARAWLKLNNMIMYTSSTAYIRHPEVDQVRLNRDFAHAQVSLALQAMADILQGSATNKEFCLSHHGRLGDLMRQFDHFQTRAYMEPSSYKDHLHRPELEGLLEKIVSGVAAIADSENTRDERKKRIVDECNNLRQALQDLLAEYEKNCGRAEPSEDLDLAMVHLGHKTKDLRRHLRRAIVDHVSDAFLDTITPLMMLIESAQRHDERATVENGKMFQEHTNKLLQAAELVCVMSNNEDGIRVIRYAAIIIDKLAPQVKLLTMAVDAMITVDDFLAVSEAHIIEDVKSGIQAVINGDGFLLDRSAGGIRGRSLRVCSVVDSEMDLVAASSYRDRVRMATKLLRDDGESYTIKSGKQLENEVAEGNSGENRDYTDDVDEFIEASELVHNAVKEIRNALLMNRNPEDVDSDNEYEEDAGTNYPDSRNQTADVENDQKIMRRLPEEEKRKIQEQIDVFKIAQSKFEREVAKWDETGNDIIVLAKHMCMIMMNMTDFTRGRGPLKTTMDVIKAAQEISDAGAKLNSLAKQIGDESVESETKKDLFAYLQRITLYCQQLNITSRVKADVQQVGNELVVSGLESAMSLIQTARNLLNAVVLTVKAAYIASTKYRRKNTAAPSLVEWKMAPPQKQPLVRVYNKPHGIVRRASEKRPMPPMKALAQFRTVNTNE